MAAKSTDMTRERHDHRLDRSGYGGTLRRFADEMDRLFDDFGFHRSWLPPRWALPWQGRAEWAAWTPDVEMFQQGDRVVVRADLPGLKKEDVNIEVKDDSLTIHGERKCDDVEEKDGIYRSERSYGSFTRVVRLPEGAMADQAKATFRNGVLEISMPAPPEHVRRGRRLEITEGAETKDMAKK